MVRHPFERLASAFQDKVILLPCLEMVSVIKIYNVKGKGAGKRKKCDPFPGGGGENGWRQVANGDMSKWLGKVTTGLLRRLFGDDSFPSFVKMLTMKNRQVKLGKVSKKKFFVRKFKKLKKWYLWI